MRRRIIFPILLAAILPAIALRAAPAATDSAKAKDGTVWAGLLLGSATAPTLGAGAETAEAKSVVQRMQRIEQLRFLHYRVLGEHVQPLLKEYESWVVPSRGFFFKLDSRGPDGRGGTRIALQLWRDREVILKSDVVLKGDRPVLVRGPALGAHGTLLLALRLTAPPSVP